MVNINGIWLDCVNCTVVAVGVLGVLVMALCAGVVALIACAESVCERKTQPTTLQKPSVSELRPFASRHIF